jgi:hypothetical protein
MPHKSHTPMHQFRAIVKQYVFISSIEIGYSFESNLFLVILKEGGRKAFSPRIRSLFPMKIEEGHNGSYDAFSIDPFRKK